MAKTLKSQRVNQIMYISIGCVIAAVILFITLFTVFNKNNNNENINSQIADNSGESQTIVEEASSSIGKTVSESEEYEEVSNNQEQSADGSVLNEQSSMENSTQDVKQSEEQTTNNEVVNEENNIAKTEENAGKSNEEIEDEDANSDIAEDPVFTMPVQGEIVKQYGKEKLIYSETLKEWTTHLGIDIKADKTTIVKASSDGCVKSIKNDPRYGLTVVIEHENGYTSVYSNLLTAEFVVVGENVKSGQTIGTVGNSATFEILDDPHLHFEILKDGNSVDPEMYIR